MLPCNGNVNASPRKLSCKLVINGNTITAVKQLSYSSGWSGTIAIGKVVSSYFSCTLPTPSFSLAGADVTLSMGIGDPVEWVTIGTFRINEESIRTRQGYTSFNAFDKLNTNTINTYQSGLTFPTTLQAVCNEVCGQIGIASVTVPVFTIEENILDGYTLRDVLGFIAAYCGANAYLSASGALDLRWYSSTSYTADGTRANIPYIGENNCTVNRLICQTQDGVLTSGSGEGMSFMCPFMTQGRLDALRVSLGGFTYRKADVDIPFGNFLLQAGDIITVTTTGSTLTVPIMNNQWDYDGGLSSKLSSYGVGDYTGTANNCERSMTMGRKQYIMREKKAASRVSEAIQEATDTITGAKGGVMCINMGQDGKPAELLILSNDIPGLTPTIQNATRVFRLNQNGLGYSNNGYSGPYATAITYDGLIVTDRFVGNTISGVTIITTAAGQSSRPKVVIDDGAIELKRVAADSSESFIGVIRYDPRARADDIDSISIRAQRGKAVTIGYEDNGVQADDFVYYSDLSDPAVPSDAAKFNIWGDLREYYNGDWISIADLADKIAELRTDVDRLLQEVFPNQ